MINMAPGTQFFPISTKVVHSICRTLQSGVLNYNYILADILLMKTASEESWSTLPLTWPL